MRKVVCVLSSLAILAVVGCGGGGGPLPAPSITTQSADSVVVGGEDATFIVVATGSALSYQWRRSDDSGATWADITGATSAGYTFSTVLADNGAQFACVVTNFSGSVTSDAATLTVNMAMPAITTQPADATVVEGQNATFTVGATGGGLSYQWRRSDDSGATWADIPGATDADYALLAATILADAGAQFSCAITNALGNVTSDAVTLQIIVPPVITTPPAGVTVIEGQDAAFTVEAAGGALAYQWRRSDDDGATWADIPGGTDADYTLVAASILVDDGAQFACTVTNALGHVTSDAATLAVGKCWKVNGAIPVPGNGETWATAFDTLQEALDTATSNDQIWVAAGTYCPTKESTPGTARTETFQLLDAVAVYGGFSGTETLRGQRDWGTYVTTLSGDIGVSGDDADNTYHVVTGADNATLDGFTITAGNADGGGSQNCGGGMYNSSSSPTVANCTFSGNSAGDFGGGMRNSASSPIVMNCSFSGNSAGSYGGGMHNSSSLPTVTNCVFSGNSASSGGGMRNDYCSPTVTSCTFSGNRGGGGGGGMYNNYASPTVTNCIFTCNVGYYGGGMCNYTSAPTVKDCSFCGNSADRGGGIRNSASSPAVTNCILWNNAARMSGPELHNIGNAATLSYCDIAGCGGSGVLWDADIGTDGGNNIDADPLFTHVPVFADMTTTSGTVSTLEVTNAMAYTVGDVVEIGVDGVMRTVSAVGGATVTFSPVLATASPGGTHVANWGQGATDFTWDLRLAGSSPCIDAGDTAALPADTADLDGDADTTEDIPYDLDGNPRVVGSEVDMGAYEEQ